MLTERLLKESHPGTVLATGIFIDSPEDVLFSNTQKPMRWVAVSGGGQDWAVYVGPLTWHVPDIASHGDKIRQDNAARLLCCTPEALKRYRP